MLDDERRADLEDAVAEMRMLDETVKTAGWQKLLVPAFIGMRAGFYKDLLNAKDLPAMFKAQAEIKSIDLLITEVDRRIREGQEAVEILSKDKPEEDEDKE